MLVRSSSVKKCSDSTVLIETPSACLETEIHRDLEARYPNIGLVFVHPVSNDRGFRVVDCLISTRLM